MRVPAANVPLMGYLLNPLLNFCACRTRFANQRREMTVAMRDDERFDASGAGLQRFGERR